MVKLKKYNDCANLLRIFREYEMNIQRGRGPTQLRNTMYLPQLQQLCTHNSNLQYGLKWVYCFECVRGRWTLNRNRNMKNRRGHTKSMHVSTQGPQGATKKGAHHERACDNKSAKTPAAREPES